MSVDEFAERVIKRTEELGLKPVDLAAATRVHQSAAERWLKGLTKPHADHIVPLAKRLDVSVAWLLTGEEQPYNELTTLTLWGAIESAAESLEREAERGLEPLTQDERERLRTNAETLNMAQQMLGITSDERTTEIRSRVVARLRRLAEAEAALQEAERVALDAEALVPPAPVAGARKKRRSSES